MSHSPNVCDGEGGVDVFDDRRSIMDWTKEANGVIQDVKECVEEISIAESLPNSNDRIYLNLTVLEGRKYTIELTIAGFRVVGENHNTVDGVVGIEGGVGGTGFHETPYSLLNQLSQRYNEVFYERLSQRLVERAENDDASPCQYDDQEKL